MPDLSQDALWYADRAIIARPLPKEVRDQVRDMLSDAWLDGYSTRDKGES
jgi:hypothetical protein